MAEHLPDEAINQGPKHNMRQHVTDKNVTHSFYPFPIPPTLAALRRDGRHDWLNVFHLPSKPALRIVSKRVRRHVLSPMNARQDRSANTTPRGSRNCQPLPKTPQKSSSKSAAGR